MRVEVMVVATALAIGPPWLNSEASAGGPQPKTLDAWNAYVAATETRIESELRATGPFLISDRGADAAAIRDAITRGDVPIAPLSSVDPAGRALSISPDDVLSMRVLDRGPDRLTLAMRLTRTKIVTATYDTEHVATYRRLGPARASSKSVSTRIVEVADAGKSTERMLAEGQDRGFLWRMNSYWRYEEVPGGVIGELESMTLSRGVPIGLGVVLEPMIDRIARESVKKTLMSVRRLYSETSQVRAASPQ